MKGFIQSNRPYLVGCGLLCGAVFCFVQQGINMERDFQRKLRDTWADVTDLTAVQPKASEPYPYKADPNKD